MNTMESEIDFSRFAELGDDILPRLDALREKDPIHWSEANGCWIVTGHDAVVEGLSAKLPLSAQRHKIIEAFFPDPQQRAEKVGYLLKIFPHFVTNTDPPEHARLRKLMMTAFSRQVAENYRPFVQEVVRQTLDALNDRVSIDFSDEVARRITARVILHVVGLPERYLPQMEYWARTFNAGLSSGNPNVEMMANADLVMRQMRDAFFEEIAHRGNNAGGDFTSYLLTARDGNDKLTEEEIIAQLMLVLIAGHDTTLNTMSLSIAKLASLPDARNYMRDNPDKFDSCIMELMRVVAMSTSMGRVVSEDFTWQGRCLKRGQFVFLFVASANRDPKAFQQPEQVDMERPQTGNQTFAPGRHLCIGHWFAKMMMSETLPAFLQRFESWDLLEDKLMFTGSTGFRGPIRVNLRLYPFRK